MHPYDVSDYVQVNNEHLNPSSSDQQFKFLPYAYWEISDLDPDGSLLLYRRSGQSNGKLVSNSRFNLELDHFFTDLQSRKSLDIGLLREVQLHSRPFFQVDNKHLRSIFVS